MGSQRLLILLSFAVLFSAATSRADESGPAPQRVRKAIALAIPLLEAGAAGSANQRRCFTCHSQAMPILALAEARRRGFKIDEENFKTQLRHTAEHLARGRTNYLEGRGQGGQVLTAGYALWALEAGGWKRDDTTAAVAEYLLQYQKDAKQWKHRGNRPPTSGSDFTATYVALRGLAAFGTDAQRERIQQRTKRVGRWITGAAARDTEDRVFQLSAMEYADDANDGTNGAARKAAEALIATQQEDGGWAQTAAMKSDAYATASVLVALMQSGGLSTKHEAVRRGMHYLVDDQLDDGSWHVVSRAQPFQKYYESGFPHEKDQFISIAASSWAVWALSLALPEPPALPESPAVPASPAVPESP